MIKGFPNLLLTLCVLISNFLVLVVFFEILSRIFLSDYMDSKLTEIVRRYKFDFDLIHSKYRDSEKEDTKPSSYPYLQMFKTRDHQKLPHPYLGFYRYGDKYRIDLVNEKNKVFSDFIAVFGGSVAENFYFFNEQKKILQKGLKNALNLEGDPGIRNYATGGYKQPQQLIATVLFRPNVKVTINIEGYNEIDMRLTRQFPHYYPMASVSRLYYSGMESWDTYVKAGKTRKYQRRLKKFIEESRWLESVTTFFKVLFFLKEKSLVKIEKRLADYQNGGEFHHVTYIDRMVYWLERSCEQQNFLANRGVKSYFFFQPAHFVPFSKKKLTENEKRMIEDQKKDRDHTSGMTKIFLLVRDLIKNKTLTLNLFDLSQIFLNEPQEVFTDGSCHINNFGNTLLAQKIVEIIKKTYSESEKPKPCRDNFRDLIENLSSSD